DLEEKEEHERTRDREQLAELVRQLYVGATRAGHRSYLIWQDSSRSSKSAMAWLLSGTSADNFIGKGDVSTGANAHAAFSGSDAIAVEGLPEGGGKIFAPSVTTQKQLAPRVFDKEIDRSWRISSFSSL